MVVLETQEVSRTHMGTRFVDGFGSDDDGTRSGRG